MLTDPQRAALAAPNPLPIGGAGVGRGYLVRPGPTSQRFIADPFSKGGDKRLIGYFMGETPGNGF
ncbi:MAG TPA: hypothetical protein VFQ44_05615 [Streptosporangiaceae bacterium]|nr:hypothetical protein [Streptosporangiaceae bacterium]